MEHTILQSLGNQPGYTGRHNQCVSVRSRFPRPVFMKKTCMKNLGKPNLGLTTWLVFLESKSCP